MSTFVRVHNEEQVPVMGGTQDAPTGAFLEMLKKQLEIKIISKNDEEIVFDLIGVDASIANALRRILLAEVPTVAIEKVWISSNSGIVQDEVLAHRVGLIPLKVDPKKLEYVAKGPDGEDEETDADTLVLHLNVYCPINDKEGVPASVNSGINVGPTGEVLSKHLQWLPIGCQSETFPEGIEPVHPDILITKLRPGQSIEFEAHCRKGIGKDHAKFSPVATASYRLLPAISFPEGRPVSGGEAKQLRSMCPADVFDIEDSVAVVSRPRNCTMCRECIRKEGWQDKVHLKRKTDHFIFTVESSGSYLQPADVVREAIAVLKDKAVTFAEIIERERSAV